MPRRAATLARRNEVVAAPPERLLVRPLGGVAVDGLTEAELGSRTTRLVLTVLTLARGRDAVQHDARRPALSSALTVRTARAGWLLTTRAGYGAARHDGRPRRDVSMRRRDATTRVSSRPRSHR